MNPDIHNLIPFTKIEKTIEKLGYGSIDITLQVHQKQIIAIEGHEFQRIKFLSDENTKAVANLLGEIKKLHDSKCTGNFSFSVNMTDGDIRELNYNRNIKEIFELKKDVTGK